MPTCTNTTPDAARAAAALADPARLSALGRTGLLDGPPDVAFDRLTQLAAQTIGAPIALVSLVDRGRQFFASALGLSGSLEGVRETPLSASFCQYTLGGEPLVVSDARENPLLRDNPSVDAGVVAYAGFPLTLEGGETLGSFCVIDGSPREWTEAELSILRGLAEAAVTEAELRLALAEAKHQALLDALTGLLNHGAFHERLRDDLGRACADGRDLSLVLFDIDHFKEINDGFGHPAGDWALKEIARRIRGELRDGDVLARVGGEEFALLLPSAAVWAAGVAERARAAIAATPIPGVGRVTVSAGLAVRGLTDDPRHLYALADAALYEAKSSGRDRVVIAGPETTLAQRSLADDRRRGVALEQRLLAFQTREHEALARVARMAAEGVSPEQVFAVVAEQLTQLMDVDAGVVWRFDADASVVVGSSGDHGSRVGVSFPAGGAGALATVRATGRPARVDYSALDRSDPTGARLVPLGYRFGVAAPVRVRGASWGAVLAATTGDAPLDTSAEERLGRFAELVGLAISEAQERQTLAQTAREHAVLRRVATLVAQETDIAPLSTVVVADAARVLGATEVSVRLRGAVIARTADPADDDLPPPATAEPALRLSVPIRIGLHASGSLDAVVAAGTGTEGALRLLEEIAELLTLAANGTETRTRVAEMADRDHLTGMPHHRAFHERLGDEVARAHRHGRRLSLVVADLDHFARVNHDHGHEAGDRILREVARRLRALARPGDSVARIGGNQFAWILPECEELAAWEAAERLRLAIASEPFTGVGAVTISAGVCDLATAENAEQLYQRAGGALYWAKRHGRDQVFLYAPDVIDALSAEERAERLERQQALSGVRMIARVVDAKDPATRRHSERVAAIAAAIAAEMGWGPERSTLLHEAGLVHDVGKIGVPDAVLFKAGPLSEDEFAQIREHAALGARIVAEVLSPEQTSWVRSHHERCGGGGYPDGLAGAAIPDGARILALADSWDVMTVARHYSAPMSTAQAVAECRLEAGFQFFPEVVDALDRLLAADSHALQRGDPVGLLAMTTASDR